MHARIKELEEKKVNKGLNYAIQKKLFLKKCTCNTFTRSLSMTVDYRILEIIMTRRYNELKIVVKINKKL